MTLPFTSPGSSGEVEKGDQQYRSPFSGEGRRFGRAPVPGDFFERRIQIEG